MVKTFLQVTSLQGLVDFLLFSYNFYGLYRKWGWNRTRTIWIGERTLDFPLFYTIYRIHPGGFKRLPGNGQRANKDYRYTDKNK